MKNDAKSLREMSSDQLQFALQEAQRQMFDLRFQSASEKLDRPSEIRRLRRHIARIQTVEREREIQALLSEAAAAV